MRGNALAVLIVDPLLLENDELYFKAGARQHETLGVL